MPLRSATTGSKSRCQAARSLWQAGRACVADFVQQAHRSKMKAPVPRSELKHLKRTTARGLSPGRQLPLRHPHRPPGLPLEWYPGCKTVIVTTKKSSMIIVTVRIIVIVVGR